MAPNSSVVQQEYNTRNRHRRSKSICFAKESTQDYGSVCYGSSASFYRRMQMKHKIQKTIPIYSQNTVANISLHQPYDRGGHKVCGDRKVIIQAQINCAMQQIKTLKMGIYRPYL